MKALIKKFIFNGFFCFMISWFLYLIDFRSRPKQNNNYKERLANFYNLERSSCIREKKIVNNRKYNLQIIIPCFNSEKYLNKCVDSILSKATNYSISIILVDDGSEDKTGSICDAYASNGSRVVAAHQKNGGFSLARNSGLDLINSDFVMFVDSDDYLDARFDLNKMLDKAYQLNKNDNTTIIEFGFIREKENKFFGKSLPKRGYLHTLDYKGFAWGKIFPSDLFISVHFPLNYWFEDTFIKMIVLFLENARCFGVPVVGYVYKDNVDSITHNYNKQKKALDSLYIMSSLLEDANKLNIPLNSQYSTIIMWQVVCTFSRTKRLTRELHESIFLETQELIYSFNIKTPSSIKYYFLHKSLIKGRINCYKRICSFLEKSK